MYMGLTLYAYKKSIPFQQRPPETLACKGAGHGGRVFKDCATR